MEVAGAFVPRHRRRGPQLVSAPVSMVSKAASARNTSTNSKVVGSAVRDLELSQRIIDSTKVGAPSNALGASSLVARSALILVKVESLIRSSDAILMS